MITSKVKKSILISILIFVTLVVIFIDPLKNIGTSLFGVSSFSCNQGLNLTFSSICRLQKSERKKHLFLGGPVSRSFLTQEFTEQFSQEAFQGGSIQSSAGLSLLHLYPLRDREDTNVKEVYFFLNFHDFLSDPFESLHADQFIHSSYFKDTGDFKEIWKAYFKGPGFFSRLLSSLVATPTWLLGAVGFPLGKELDESGQRVSESHIKSLGANKSFRSFGQGSIRVDSHLLGRVNQLKNKVFPLEKKQMINQKLWKALVESLVRRSEALGVRMHIVLLPVHPDFFDPIDGDRKSTGVESQEGVLSQIQKDFIQEQYFTWVQGLKSLARNSVLVHDLSQGGRFFPATSLFWKNALDFTPLGASLLFSEIHKETQSVNQ